MKKGEECFILLVKKQPNLLETKFGHRNEVVIFIRKKIVKPMDEGIDLVEWKWFYYEQMEDIKDQLVKSNLLNSWLNNQMREWFIMNDSSWKKLEENEKEKQKELNELKNMKDEEVYREELNVLIEEMGFSEEQARNELKEEIAEAKENIKEMIEELEEELDGYDCENYGYDDNLDFQKNGTYKYMNINVFKRRYNIIS